MPEGRWTRIARRSAWPQCTARWAGRTERSPHASARTARWSGCGWPTSARGISAIPWRKSPGPPGKMPLRARQKIMVRCTGGRRRPAATPTTGRTSRCAGTPREGGTRPHVRGSLEGLQGGGPAQQDPTPRAPPCGKPGERIAAGGRRRRSWRRAARVARGRDPCDGGRHGADVRRAPDGAAQGIPRRRAAVSNGLDAGGTVPSLRGEAGPKTFGARKRVSRNDGEGRPSMHAGRIRPVCYTNTSRRGRDDDMQGDCKSVQGPEDPRRSVHQAVPDPLQRRKNACGPAAHGGGGSVL